MFSVLTSEVIHFADDTGSGSRDLRRLDDFLRKHGVSLRDVEVYKEWELYNVPTDSVCKRHGIKTSNLHKIVCVVNGILRRCGRDLLKDE